MLVDFLFAGAAASIGVCQLRGSWIICAVSMALVWPVARAPHKRAIRAMFNPLNGGTGMLVVAFGPARPTRSGFRRRSLTRSLGSKWLATPLVCPLASKLPVRRSGGSDWTRQNGEGGYWLYKVNGAWCLNRRPAIVSPPTIRCSFSLTRSRR